MDEITKLITENGFTIAFLSSLIYCLYRYLPQFIEIRLQRMRDKDEQFEVLKKIIEHNTVVIDNNSKLLEKVISYFSPTTIVNVNKSKKGGDKNDQPK